MKAFLLSCSPPADADVGAAEGGANCSAFSSAIDEGLELSQRLCESLFPGPDGELDPEREEQVLGACTRLRAAVDTLLELVSDSTAQVRESVAIVCLGSRREQDADTSFLFCLPEAGAAASPAGRAGRAVRRGRGSEGRSAAAAHSASGTAGPGGECEESAAARAAQGRRWEHAAYKLS